jgi:hypothetical protein
MAMLRAAAWALASLLAASLPSLVLANGDLFFEAFEIPGQPEYVVFGNVKDDRGNYLEGAIITVSVEEPFLSYTSESGLLGRFRTLDVGRAIKGLGYDVDPSLIKVTVSYPGYEVARSVHRGKYGQNKGAVEINFIMRKTRSK